MKPLQLRIGRPARGGPVAVGVLCLLACLAGDCRAAAALAAGQRYADWIAVGGKQVPLPQGEWEIAGLGTQLFDRPEFGAYGAIENVILFRRLGRGVVAVTEINANSVPVDDGWGLAAELRCAQPSSCLLTRYRTGWDLSCMLVQPTYAPTGRSGSAGVARSFAAGSGRRDRRSRSLAYGGVSDQRSSGCGRRALPLRTRHPDRSAGGTAPTIASTGRRTPSPATRSGWRRGPAARVLGGGRGRVDRARPAQPAGRGPALDMPRRAAFFSNTPQIDAKLRDLERLHRARRPLQRPTILAQQQEALAEVPGPGRGRRRDRPHGREEPVAARGRTRWSTMRWARRSPSTRRSPAGWRRRWSSPTRPCSC